MNLNFKEIAKDVGFGLALVGGIAGTLYGLITFMELVNMTKDSIRLMIATPLFLYFCWSFGGLTRHILNRD
tara:strand:+ start:329 stop:541 length:213 start_codon:yes stop_codon:yes gene_type:complete